MLSILSDDVGFLDLGKGIGLGRGICFLGLGRGVGLDTLDLGMGIGILDLCGLVNRSSIFLDVSRLATYIDCYI